MNYLHLLTLIFIGLKVSNAIAWSWWLVLLPTIISGALAALLLLFAFVCVLLAARG